MKINIFKIWAIIILIGAAYSIYKSTVVSIEETITIQTFLFYILIAWALFGMYFVVRYMNEDFYKNREKEE